MERLVRLFARHRAAVATFVCLLSALAAYGVTQLKFDDDPRNIFRTQRVDFQQLEEQFAEFGSDDNDCVFVIEGPNLISAGPMATIRQLVTEIAEVPGVERVVSPLDAKRASGIALSGATIPLIPEDGSPPESFERARAAALSHPMVAGQLLSADGETMLLVAKLERGSLRLTPMESSVARFHEIAGKYKGRDDLQVRLTGVPPIRFEIIRHIERDLIKFNVLGCVLAVGITYLVFRQFSAVLMVIAAPAIGSLWIIGAFGLAGVSVNVLNAVVPTLVLVVGLTDSVHFLLDIKRSRAAHIGELDASMASIEHVGVACGLTSLTSAVGFASLVVARADIIRGFGLACAAGSVLTFLAVITIVPLLASTRLSRHLGEHRDRDHLATRWANAVVRWATEFPWTISLAGIAGTFVLGWIALRLQPDSWVTENLPSHSESSAAMEHCDQTFGGVLFIHALLEWSPDQTLASPEVHAALVDVHELFDSHPQTRSPMSVLNVTNSPPLAGQRWSASVRSLERGAEDLTGMLRADKRHALISAHVQDSGAAQAVPVIHELQGRLTEIEARHPGIKLRLTGTSVVASENITTMIGDLGSSLGLESVVIFGLMTWSFRSLLLGMVSIVPNVFPLVCVAAWMVWRGMPLQFGSVIVFNICLGLAVDDTIHVMTKFKREMAGGSDVRGAIRRSFSLIGTAVLTTTFILLVGFGVVTLSDIPALKLFGTLSCITILAALVGELVLTPALLMAFLGPKYRAQGAAADDATATEWQSLILAQDQPAYPQTLLVRMQLTGALKRWALQSALTETVARYPRLLCRATNSGGTWRWESGTPLQPRLMWIRPPAGGLPAAGFIDLATECGVRGWVIEQNGDSQLVLEFHRACCNLSASMQFAGELLQEYAAQLGDCSHVQSGPRSHEAGGEQPAAVNERAWLAGLGQFARYAARRPVSLATASTKARVADVADDYPASVHRVLEAEEVKAWDDAANQLSATRRELLLCDLFDVLDKWLTQRSSTGAGGWLRIGLTGGDASAGQRQSREHDEVGCFVDQRGGLPERESLADIQRQLATGSAQSTALAAWLPRASRLSAAAGELLDARQGTLNCCIIDDAFSQLPLPRESGRLVAGNVSLESVELLPSLRPCAPLALSVVGYGQRITIALHYDSRIIAKRDAEQWLNALVLRMLSRPTEQEAAPAYENARR